MNIFWPQHYETWNQPQEKIWKDHKYMEVKQQATKQWMGQPGNQRRNKTVRKQMKMKTWQAKTFEMQQKWP